MTEPDCTKKNHDVLAAAQRAYQLGAMAATIMLEKPEGWKRKIRRNISEARKIGVTIDENCFFDAALPGNKK